MTTAVIVGGLLLVGLGLVASQLFRLKDWLNRQPKIENPVDGHDDGHDDGHEGPPNAAGRPSS